MDERTLGKLEHITTSIAWLSKWFRVDMDNGDNEKLSEQHKSNAFNCAMRIGQIVSEFKCEFARIVREQKLDSELEKNLLDCSMNERTEELLKFFERYVKP